MGDDGARLEWSHTLLNLNTQKLAAPSYPKNTSLRLPIDGEGLSSILAGLRLEHPAKFSGIVNQLRTVVPNLTDIRVRRTQIGPESIGHEILFDLKGADGISAGSVSEGTLLTLGVLTALSTCDSPQVALIDDLERGLHPKALGHYIDQLRILQKQDPELQIIATSHSPYLLDYLRAEEVLLTSLDENGYTVVKSLTDHPDYERWKEVMGPGEFWSTVGEDWITKEKKATA
jgi:predicted ATPase